jgi:hypothetical protein
MNTLIFHSNDLAMAQSSSVQFNSYIRFQTKLLGSARHLFFGSDALQQLCDIAINRSGFDKILVLFAYKIW